MLNPTRRNRQKTKLALFEERDRIARDLHDRVIQRIFAAGLQMASLSRMAKKEVAAHGITDSKLPDSLDTVRLSSSLPVQLPARLGDRGQLVQCGGIIQPAVDHHHPQRLALADVG